MKESCFFFFNDTATTEIYTLSLHDALPICLGEGSLRGERTLRRRNKTPMSIWRCRHFSPVVVDEIEGGKKKSARDRKSTRLNSSHANISYAVFCLKKKNDIIIIHYI